MDPASEKTTNTDLSQHASGPSPRCDQDRFNPCHDISQLAPDDSYYSHQDNTIPVNHASLQAPGQSSYSDQDSSCPDHDISQHATETSNDPDSKLCACQLVAASPTASSDMMQGSCLQKQDLEEIHRICQTGDFYEVLGVHKKCSQSEIQAAYKKHALRLHPDKCKLPRTVQAFQDVLSVLAKAYAVLGDADQRHHYDQAGNRSGPSAPKPNSSGMSPDELFCLVFTGVANPGKMTMSDLIINNYVRLESKLDGSTLCSSLLQKKLIMHHTYQKYQTEPYPTNIRSLLGTLMRRPKQDVTSFLEALLETRQEHLIFPEKGEHSKDELLVKFRVQWEQELNSECLAPHLYHEGVLTVREYDQFIHIPAKQAQNQFLLDRLRCAPVWAFQRFQELLTSVPQAMLPAAVLPQIGGPQGACIQCSGSADQLQIDEDRVRLVPEEVRKHYTDSLGEMPLIPWEDKCGQLNHLYTTLTLVKEASPGGQRKEVPLKDHHEIFQQHKDEMLPPRRIHIIGQAGVGKPTLTNKLAMEWAEMVVDQTCRLMSFHAVLLIRLRTITTNIGLEEIIKDQLFDKRSDTEVRHLEIFLKRHTAKILFILDGFDEYRNQSEDINDLVRGNLYRDSTVLLTSRPTRRPSPHCTRHRLVDVTGYDKQNQLQYMRKYFSEEPHKSEELQKKLETYSLGHLAKIPIMLLILCSLFARTGTIPDSLVALYSQLVDFMYDRHQEKSGSKFSLRDVLMEIGNFTLQNLLTGHLEFEINSENANLKRCLEIGLLHQIPIQTRLPRRDKTFVCFLHKTFHEYVAAKYIFESGQYQPLIQHCINIETILELDKLLEFLFGLHKEASLSTNTAAGSGSGSATESAFSSQSAEENIAVGDQMLAAGDLAEKLNSVVAREVRTEEKLWGDVFGVFGNDRSLSEVWELLMQCYGRLGQTALCGAQGWTRDMLSYRNVDSVALVVADSKRWRCPPAPAALYIDGADVHPAALSLSLSAAGGYLHLKDMGGWGCEVDVSRLALVYLWWVRLDVKGLQLLTRFLHRLQLVRVTVTGEQEEDKEVDEVCDCSWRAVYLSMCKLSVASQRLVARALTAATHLQHLEVRDTELEDMEDAWWQPPAHLHSVRLYAWGELGAVREWAREGLRLQGLAAVLDEPYCFQSEGYRHIEDQHVPTSLWT